jgi:hypothetical protein
VHANTKEFVKAFLAVCVSTGIFVGAIEVGLRIINIPPEPIFGWKWARSPYKSDANNLDTRVNQLELRGRPIEYGKNDFVIVILGDSYTEAGTHAFEEMPEQILEKLLHEKYGFDSVRVFSIASAGWGQDQQLVGLLEYFSRFRADLVLMWLTPINDYWENGNVDRSISQESGPLKPTFRMRGSDIELAYPQHRWKLRLLIERALAHLKYGNAVGLERLYTSWWLGELPESNLTSVPRSMCPLMEVEQLDVVSSFHARQAAITAITTEDLPEGRSHFSHFLIPHSKREDYQINITHRLIDEIAKLATSHSASFRMFYPKGSDIDKALGVVKCVREATTGKYYSSDLSDLTADLSNIGLGRALLKININSDVPTIISSRDWHLNRLGNILAMDALAQQLIEQKLLQREKKSMDIFHDD